VRLAVRKLAKAYGFMWALRDVNLELAPGDFVALLGPNGAGKTTLLKLLAGLIEPTQGQVDFDGATLAPSDPQRRRQIGLLSPADHLYDNLTVFENIKFFSALYRRGAPPQAIERALAEVNLLERAGEYAGNLSSGMKCRLSLAKWQLIEPGLLLLDEPYGVLDGSGVDLLENFLKAHCARGNIVIMASHHVARVLKLCTRSLILHQGRLTFDEARQEPWPSFNAAFGAFLPHGEAWRS
jgi:heme ABC exporter ATP-binding subunit CcmA